MGWVKHDADSRQKEIKNTFVEAFSDFLVTREVETIVFSEVSALKLAEVLFSYPLILKPLLAVCNIAGRAIERDLDLKNINTYEPKLSDDKAKIIAGYIKPFLPPYLEIPALCQVDRIAFVDKEIRKRKGQWEKKITASLNKFSSLEFQKRKFIFDGEQFELDAAYPKQGDLEIGIDVKRIEARRDIHKRCDEMVNKAAKLKSCFPKAKFGAVIYYPFREDHINVNNRLRSENIDVTVFASESIDSIKDAVKFLIKTLGESENDTS